jgi:transcriptional regulator with XRE-family HTH domain
MAKNLIVDTVKELSQQEGLNDSEIAKKLGYARGSIQRIRRDNNIPVANKENRKDKKCKCVKCTSTFFTRRNDPPQILCENCAKEVNQAFDSILKQ